MSRAATAGRRRGARGSDFRAGSGGGERAWVFLEGLVRGGSSRRGGSAAAAAAAAGALLLCGSSVFGSELRTRPNLSCPPPPWRSLLGRLDPLGSRLLQPYTNPIQADCSVEDYFLDSYFDSMMAYFAYCASLALLGGVLGQRPPPPPGVRTEDGQKPRALPFSSRRGSPLNFLFFSQICAFSLVSSRRERDHQRRRLLH